jgi:prenyltransferase beta subunit
MWMGRRSWLTLALAIVLAAGSATSLAGAAPRNASSTRPKTITRGLDYLHSRQQTDGGFGSMANTAWGILGAVASGERMGSSLWTIAGRNPYRYLQSNNHVTAAANDSNAPVYYARAIMSYVAVGHLNEVFRAGTPAADLLAKLYSYQDFIDGSPTKGRFSNLVSIPTRQAVDSTAWAILGMQAVGARDQVRFGPAVTWLLSQQNTDGGFSADQVPDSSNAEDTALAIQALQAGIAAGVAVPPAAIQDAQAYLKDHQRSDGGFPYAPGGPTDGTATAAAIQAIIATGDDPSGASWTRNGNTPLDALASLQQKNGGYKDRAGDSGANLVVTSWALVALRSKPFTTYPKNPGSATKGFIYRPQIKSAEPKNKAKFTGTHSVLIHAKYTDGTKAGQVGTGVNPKACRVYVDNVNRTKHAKIGTEKLSLQLKNVPNGAHTYKLRIVDHAGNVKELVRSFTVAVPTPTPTPTTPAPVPLPTYHPPTTYPTATSTPTPSTTLYPTPTSTPGTSTSPYPNGTVSGAPVSSPSPSGSPGVGATAGGGSAAGFVGGTLLALLPIGAAVSYLAFHRREQALDAAGEGKVLPGGGSSWERLRGSLAKLKDIVKPAGRQ